MSIPTNLEILSLLDELDRGKCADDLETYHLDFKPFNDPKEDKKIAFEYAVCFANAEGGVVVFGVADKERGGRTKAIHGSGNLDLDEWQRAIYQSTTPHLSVGLDELQVPEGTGRILLMRVPKGPNPPYGTSQGLYKKRVSTNCMPMDLQAESAYRIATGVVDWSGHIAEGVRRDDLDPVPISNARNFLRALKPGSTLLQASDDELLSGLRAIYQGQVTNTGLLLFGRPNVLEDRCPQHQVHYVHQTHETKVDRNEILRNAVMEIIPWFTNVFISPINPEQEVSVGLLKVRIPAFPMEAVREAVLNAITHRDYSQPGKIMIRHTPRELVITSPGSFISGITPANILRHESSTRNQTLANAFLKLGLVEQAGVGRKRIFSTMLSYGKKIPNYEADAERVTLHLYDGTVDERMARLVAERRSKGMEIDLDGLLILSYLREHAFIDSGSGAELLQLSHDASRAILDKLSQPHIGLFEKRGRTRAATYHFAKPLARELFGKAGYTKAKGIDPIRNAEMIRTFLQDHQSITPAECRELLGLGDSPTAKVEVSRILRKLSGLGGFLQREGKSRNIRYVLK